VPLVTGACEHSWKHEEHQRLSATFATSASSSQPVIAAMLVPTSSSGAPLGLGSRGNASMCFLAAEATWLTLSGSTFSIATRRLSAWHARQCFSPRRAKAPHAALHCTVGRAQPVQLWIVRKSSCTATRCGCASKHQEQRPVAATMAPTSPPASMGSVQSNGLTIWNPSRCAMVANSFALRAAFDAFGVGCFVLSVVAFLVFVFLRFFDLAPPSLVIFENMPPGHASACSSSSYARQDSHTGSAWYESMRAKPRQPRV